MRAVVWTGKDRIELQERPIPPVGPGWVQVRVRSVGVCGTDHHIIRGEYSFAPPPLILGHEIAGQVTEIGPGVSGWTAGDRVVVDAFLACGECYWCQSGRRQLCDRISELGTSRDGGFAEYVTVPAANLHRLPDLLSFDEGALMELLTCCLGALTHFTLRPGIGALVIGSGVSGLIFAQLVRIVGASRVAIAGRWEESLQVAAQLGIERCLDVRQEDMASSVAAYFAGRGPELVIEAAGSPQATLQAVELCAKGGMLILFGVAGTTAPTIPGDSILLKNLSLFTSIGAPALYDDAIRLAQDGVVQLQPLINGHASLEEFVAMSQPILQREKRFIKLILHP